MERIDSRYRPHNESEANGKRLRLRIYQPKLVKVDIQGPLSYKLVKSIYGEQVLKIGIILRRI
jgi:hypothetical protein